MADTLTAQIDDDERAPATPAVLFVVINGEQPGPGARHLLDGLDRVTIGRGPSAHVRSKRSLRIDLDDARASSAHAELACVAGTWHIRDLGSKNGVAVNGRRVFSTQLADRDWIGIGQTVLRFRTLRVNPEASPDVVAQAGGTMVPDVEGLEKRLGDVAGSGIPVLLLGETGVGKELAARALHARSRRKGAFVAVNCAGLVENLAASTMFGHRRGAFTSAIEDRLGAFRAADGGTLLLDEIADLPLATQGALLRTLQEREVVAVGDTRAHPVDVRIVAATRKEIDIEVEAGRFRIDLFARIQGLRITLVPLRERIEDLGGLLAACLARHAPGRRISLAPSAVARILQHRWPLNIRELDQAIAAALALAPERIDVEHLPETMTPVAAAVEPRTPRKEALEELLRAHRGNLAAVARALGTSRAQVHRLMKRFELDPAGYRAT